MSRITIFCLVLTLALAFLVSCSGGNENAVAPPAQDQAQVEKPGTTNLLGFWQVVINTQDKTIEATDLRSSDLILNVLGFMEPPPLTSMSIDFDTLVIADPTISVDVIFSHPIPDPVFKGFDVRGIVFGADVTNADGYTDVCNPEFFAGVPFGYQDGLLGVPDSVADYSGLAAYKYFADGIGLNDDVATFFSDEGNLADRGVFSEAPTKHSRHYELDWTDTGQPFFTFNYAVYANYNWPVGDPGDGVSAWDITTANSAEAFACKVTELANSLWYSGGTGGGSISLEVEVWDWQGDITNVSVQSWDGTVIPESFFDVFVGPGSTSKSYVYQFNNLAGDPTTTGDLDLLITATDVVTFGEAWFFAMLPTSNAKYDDPLYNCFKYTTTVIECAPPVPTAINPNKMQTYPGAYTAVSITGNYFTLAGGVTEVYITDGTNQADATNINVISDTSLTCDFNLSAGTPPSGTCDVVVVTACNGVGPDLVTVVNNLLFKQNFANGNGNCTGNYVYCSSSGWWEESTCNNNYPVAACQKFMTPAFNAPTTAQATAIHFALRHSFYMETFWDGICPGWTTDNGVNMWGDCCDGNNVWKYESGQNFTYNYLVAFLFYPSCIGCGNYYNPGYSNFCWSGNYGTVGTGIWSQFKVTAAGGENLFGMSNVKFMLVCADDGSVEYRGHEVYELIVWFDPV